MVDGVEADGICQCDHGGLGVRVVARDEQQQPVAVAGRAPVGAELRPDHRVEGLDDVRPHQVRGDQLARGRPVLLEVGQRAITPGSVIGGIDDDLARKGPGRQLVIEEKRHREHDHVAGRCGGRDVRGSVRVLAEFADERRETLGADAS